MRKKVAVIVTCLIVCCSMAAACGDVDVTESTIELKKDGKITEYTIEDFSQSYYEHEELKNYIENTVNTYLDSHEGSIKIKKSEVEEQTAYLTMTYDSVNTFRDFSRLSCFSGSISEAQSAGYDFDTDFIQVTGEDDADSSADNSSVQSMIPFDAIEKDDAMKVFVIGENINVIVPGKIAYVSAEHTKVTAANTVSVSKDDETSGENDLIYVLYK